jgi:desumoylating isopeptidase 1
MTSLNNVRLYIYDISFGLASAYGSSLLGNIFVNKSNIHCCRHLSVSLSRSGRPIDGVWHTGVAVYGREYLFGSSGVSYTSPEEIHRQGLAPKPKAYVGRMFSPTSF